MSELQPYINSVKLQILKLKKADPKDRLDIASSIEECLKYVNDSCLGWYSWISKPHVLKVFEEEELRQFYELMRQLAIQYLELDVRATEQMLAKSEKKKEEKNPLSV